jgi:hypothetical protein
MEEQATRSRHDFSRAQIAMQMREFSDIGHAEKDQLFKG